MAYELHNEKPQTSLEPSTEIMMVREKQRYGDVRSMVMAGEQN